MTSLGFAPAKAKPPVEEAQEPRLGATLQVVNQIEPRLGVRVFSSQKVLGSDDSERAALAPEESPKFSEFQKQRGKLLCP